jgi:hypothetical protein
MNQSFVLIDAVSLCGPALSFADRDLGCADFVSHAMGNAVPPTTDETDLIESTLKSSSIDRSLLRISTFSSAGEIL